MKSWESPGPHWTRICIKIQMQPTDDHGRFSVADCSRLSPLLQGFDGCYNGARTGPSPYSPPSASSYAVGVPLERAVALAEELGTSVELYNLQGRTSPTSLITLPF